MSGWNGDGGANAYVVRMALKRGDGNKGNQKARTYRGHAPSNGQFGHAPECGGCKFQLTCIGNNDPSAAEDELVPCTTLKKIDCVYHSSTILSVDFIEKRISCFGFRNRSISTAWNLDAYIDAVSSQTKGVPDWVWREFEKWTNFRYWQDRCYTRSAELKKVIKEHRERFDPPWLKREYFYWEKFEPHIAKDFENSINFLCRDQNYRYFRFDWTEGVWGYNFIDEAARRRHAARLKKRSRNGAVSGPVLGDADGAPGGGREA
jgi:hypothetical protein